MPTEHKHNQPVSSEDASEAPQRRPWIPPGWTVAVADCWTRVRQTKYTTPEAGVQSGATTS